MASRTLLFYFDFISPYTYLASRRIGDVCQRHDVQLVQRPIVYAALLNHWGLIGPAEVDVKREWTFKDVLRHAAVEGIEFRGPKLHPFNSITALRLALPEVAGSRQSEIIDVLWKAGWADGADLGSADELTAALDHAGFDGKALVERTRQPEAKEALRRNSDEAIARGVFGVPTFVIEDELFWGNDRIPFLELYLEGRDPLDRSLMREMLGRARGADRRAAKTAS